MLDKLKVSLTQAELSLLDEYLDKYTMIQVINPNSSERWLKFYHPDRLPLIVSFKGN